MVYKLYEMSTISNKNKNNGIDGDFIVLVHGSGDIEFSGKGNRQEHGTHFHLISKEQDIDLSVDFYTLELLKSSWEEEKLIWLKKKLIEWLQKNHHNEKDSNNYMVTAKHWEDENQDKFIDYNRLYKF